MKRIDTEMFCLVSRFFSNLKAYLPKDDQNRIKLQSASSEHEAYINASPLELPFARRNYILTQGPLPNTTGDFWQMIYEQNGLFIRKRTNILTYLINGFFLFGHRVYRVFILIKTFFKLFISVSICIMLSKVMEKSFVK